jgi:hypothetical protein
MDKKCHPINKKSPFVYNWGYFLMDFCQRQKSSKKSQKSVLFRGFVVMENIPTSS